MRGARCKAWEPLNKFRDLPAGARHRPKQGAGKISAHYVTSSTTFVVRLVITVDFAISAFQDFSVFLIAICDLIPIYPKD